MSHDPETLARLRLNLVPGVGSLKARALLERFGAAEAVFAASVAELTSVPGVKPDLAREILDPRRLDEAQREAEAASAAGVAILHEGLPSYPLALAVIPDPPVILYVAGGLRPSDAAAVAIVGSRRATPHGRSFARKLAADLASAGVTVVSGLAVGIDAAAHEGALSAGGRTIAVQGRGLSGVYPEEHKALAARAAASGAVISEFPMGYPPIPENFPRRNRIISGLSLGVVVVEAAMMSGSLVTARHASEQGREVFAVPGVAGSREAQGTHALLRDGARLVETAADVLEELTPHLAARVAAGKAAAAGDPEEAVPPGLSSDEAEVLGALDAAGASIDAVAARVAVPFPRVSAALASLSLKRLVDERPGKVFSRRV